MEFDEDGRFIGFKPKEQIKSIEQECREIEEKEEEVSTFVEDIFISLKYGVFCGYLTQAGIRFSKDISLLGYGDNDNGYDPEPQYA